MSEAGSRGAGLLECHEAQLQRFKAAALVADVTGARAHGQGLGAAVRLREKCDIMSQICLEPMRGKETPPSKTHSTHAPLQCLREKPRNPAFRLNLRHGARTACLPSTGRMRQRGAHPLRVWVVRLTRQLHGEITCEFLKTADEPASPQTRESLPLDIVVGVSR